MSWPVETLVATSLLMALVLLLRRPAGRQFGAAAAYALWLVPLARFLLPPLPSPVEAPAMLIETGNAVGAAASNAVAAASGPSGAVLLALWLGGAGLFLLAQFISYRRFLARALAAGRPIAEPSIKDAAVIETGAVSGPAATGLLIRRIFVPEGFAARFGTEERGLALAHEAMHHRRGDLWASAVALLLLALHWWNPLAYLAHRAFRRDLEAACDASLIAATGEGKRALYANTILRCVAQPMPHPTCALTNLSELKGRLMMLTLNHGLLRRRAGLALAASLAAGGLFVALPASAQPKDAKEPTTERVEVRKIITHGDRKGDERIELRGDQAELRAKMASCKGETFEATAGVEGKDDKVKKTRIMLCGKPGASKAETAAMLEKALGKIQGTDEMPAENKAEIVAKLQARIAALRAGS